MWAQPLRVFCHSESKMVREILGCGSTDISSHHRRERARQDVLSFLKGCSPMSNKPLLAKNVCVKEKAVARVIGGKPRRSFDRGPKKPSLSWGSLFSATYKGRL